MSSPIVEIDHLSLNYHTKAGETKALEDLTLSVDQGEFIGIVGPSGCGKSTLLSLIAGLIHPSSGSVRVNHKEVKKPSINVGYMFQNDHLFEWKNISSNVCLGLEIQNRLTPETKKNAEHLLDKYGLGDFKHSYPSELSGGMRQRVALIRTLACNPELLLLDEPFSALDYQTRITISNEISTILKNENKTTILVTHDIAEAISLSSRIVILTDRPGKVKRIIPITFDMENPTPLKLRSIPKFQLYFQEIWKELN